MHVTRHLRCRQEPYGKRDWRWSHMARSRIGMVCGVMAATMYESNSNPLLRTDSTNPAIHSLCRATCPPTPPHPHCHHDYNHPCAREFANIHAHLEHALARTAHAFRCYGGNSEAVLRLHSLHHTCTNLITRSMMHLTAPPRTLSGSA